MCFGGVRVECRTAVHSSTDSIRLSAPINTVNQRKTTITLLSEAN